MQTGQPLPMEANARLIAAAPTLYEALTKVVAIADRKTVEFDKARAALALADGQGESRDMFCNNLSRTDSFGTSRIDLP
jgi:hypothetical protein